ncbi:hydrogen peroxide-inducible genes activator [Paracrocinitomix mangrovi]|uniref:hydrogen peroxide-inducible genes activator n=1 Tax=Paracrocinitomix mangrovi TaxID=2862509 RepID=UPI001C8E6A11|nr:hydrogen peroxide-inducible genes activator [Paracrocinitomix mangrovi]UKN02401.1 hydrogen peroxide-inducible genes activator [Paracrocinitomix mangrovi]
MHSLVQLEYIVAVDTYRQFSIAAEKCFVTQPTLSMQIKKLENDLDITIFDRSKQPVVPTEIGKIIIDQARIILAESAKIGEIVQANKNTVVGELKLGIIPSVAPYLLPVFIGKLTKTYPDLEIKIKELLTEEILAELEKDTLDVGIISTPVPNGGFTEIPLYFEKIFIYCHPKHPLYEKEKITLDEISNENIWLLSQGHCFRSQVINVCALKESGNKLPFSYESASIETLIKMVDREGGLTLIPELAVNDLTPSKQSRVKEIKGLNPIREIGLVTNRIFVKQRTLEALKNVIQDVLPAEILNEKRGDRVDWK